MLMFFTEPLHDVPAAALGAVNVISLAVVLAPVRFIERRSRPIEMRGKVDGFPGLHSLERYAPATNDTTRRIIATRKPRPYLRRSTGPSVPACPQASRLWR